MSKAAYYYVALLVVNIVGIILIAAYFTLRLGVIAALIIAALTLLIEVRLNVVESSKAVSDSSKEIATRVVSLLTIHNDYFNDNWLQGLLDNIVNLRKIAEGQAHDLRRFEKIMINALDDAKREMGRAFRINTDDDELERILRLKDSVDGAKDYVYALTYDARDYFDKFWDKVFGLEYVRSNVETAGRGVKIKRIFVVGKKVLNGADTAKLGRLKKMANDLVRAGKNMEIYFAAIEDLPKSLIGSDTSFLVVDGYVGSESDGISEGKSISGYVAYGDASVVNSLIDRFNKILPYAAKN
jgi:hypothetical protein